MSRGGARALAALAAALLACGGPARRAEEAATLEREGRPLEALAAYQAVLGELGEGPLEGEPAALRVAAVRRAAELSYLHGGDYAAAVAYYRRLVALAPGTPGAREARERIAEIYVERFRDPVGAIAQWAALAQEGGPGAAAAQLQVARLYLAAQNPEQARTEARALREQWPGTREAGEAHLVVAQAFAQEKKVDEAARAYEEVAAARPGGEVAARALESAANLLADDGRLDAALALYARAEAGHPNPEAVRTSLEAVRRRRDAKGVSRPGDRAAALDAGVRLPATPRKTTKEKR